MTATGSWPSPEQARRRDELAAALAATRARVGAAARAAGRDPETVTIIAVTKNWPAQDVRILASLGVADVGENRDQEAAEKAALCADLALTWHFVGQLQTNKAKSVVGYADVVHSVDRVRLVDALSHAAQSCGRTVGCLLQVSLDGDTGRGGAAAVDVPALADRIATGAGLRLLGVMGVAPLGQSDDPAEATGAVRAANAEDVAERAFARLAELAAIVRVRHPGAGWISAGMSGDLELAIAHGATHVRVGSAILGARRDLR